MHVPVDITQLKTAQWIDRNTHVTCANRKCGKISKENSWTFGPTVAINKSHPKQWIEVYDDKAVITDDKSFNRNCQEELRR